MNKDVQSRSVKTPLMRRVFIYTVVLLVVFLLGFIPMWWQSREASRSLAKAEQQLILVQMQNSLASATIDAWRGDYESARQYASDFFTAVRTEIDKGVGSAFSPAQREGVLPLLTQRDEMVTLLARSDPAAAARLPDLYSAYREIMK